MIQTFQLLVLVLTLLLVTPSPAPRIIHSTVRISLRSRQISRASSTRRARSTPSRLHYPPLPQWRTDSYKETTWNGYALHSHSMLDDVYTLSRASISSAVSACSTC